MRMIVVAGMPGAGKEEFLSAGRAKGIPFVRMGDLVREFYAASGAEAKGMSLGQFAGAEREAHGTDVWAKRAVEKVEGKVFMIDGCRSMDEVRAFRKHGEVVIVSVHASPSVRYARLVKRGREDAPKNIEEFEARDAREISWGSAEVIALSDLTIENMSSLEDFRKRSAELLEGLL
ncbi:MAG: AAA family ATPase [Methanomethylophilus sp.]|jgi:dephospho-CoA kinase